MKMRYTIGAAVFQEPMTSLNPLHRIGDQIKEVLDRHQSLKGRAATAKAIDLLEQVAAATPDASVSAGRASLALRTLDGICLRYRRHGERCRPVGRSGSHPLKKLFQEYGVPPWLRCKCQRCKT